MDPILAYHAATDVAVRLAGGCDKLVHVNAGLAIYVGVQLLLPTRRASARAFVLVALLEGANEVMDRLFWGGWRWQDTIGDVVATLLWPGVLLALGKLRRRRWAREQSWRDLRPPSSAAGLVGGRSVAPRGRPMLAS